MGKFAKTRKGAVKKIYKTIEYMVGEYEAGLLLAGLADALDSQNEGTHIRKITLVINDFFETVVYDEKGNEGENAQGYQRSE